MKAKETFLRRIEQNIQSAEAKLKTYRDAYEYNAQLPDEFFEGLSDMEIPKHHNLNGSATNIDIDTDEYGAQINAVRKIITNAGESGIGRRAIVVKFPFEGEKEQLYTMVTNAISSLRKKGEVEKFKPKGMVIKGYYWRMKKR